MLNGTIHPHGSPERFKQEIMTTYTLQREVRTAHSESYFVVDAEDRDVGRLDVHFPQGMVHATLIVRENLTEEELREIVNRFIQEMNQLVGVDGIEVAVHAFQGEERGVFHNDDLNGRRNGNGHSNN
ncbi:MAG: hypothetical protein OXC83_05075 [Chloroflexi bacterium]|nr:hypothetical protein [Chloroflexota bacterium]